LGTDGIDGDFRYYMINERTGLAYPGNRGST